MFFKKKKKKVMYTVGYADAVLEYNQEQFDEFLEYCNENGTYKQIISIKKREE